MGESAGELVQKFRDRELGPEELVAAMVQRRQEEAPAKSEAVKQAERALWRLERYLQQ